MFSYYTINERTAENGIWGESNDTFFAADNEKYLGFGNLVQLTRSLLQHNGDYTSMKLHKNMEIVDIIIKGSVGFQDSDGQVSSFPASTVRVLSAGSGIYQREFNTGVDTAEKIQLGFLPENLNQSTIKTKAIFSFEENKNKFIELISPVNVSSLTIRQNAAVLLGEFDADKHIGYTLGNRSIGLFVYVISGKMFVHNNAVVTGEAVGIRDEEHILFHTNEPSRLLLVESEIIEQMENR